MGRLLRRLKNANKRFRILEFSVEKLIKGLWWGDFELLVDLVFSRLGWQRYSVLGKEQKELILIYIHLRRIKEFLYKLNQIQTLNSYMNIFQNLKINTILNIRKCIIFIIRG